ncbi:MAG: hypothetical protein NC311_02795 [Muribaculaceae bacterium]|nr:hypothetical protein [Muribaculaceae bacterium]
MKQSQNTNPQYVYKPATRAQKIWGVIALVGLFACGLMVGITWRGHESDTSTDSTVQFTESQCDMIADKIQRAVKNESFEKLEKLTQIYAVSCDGHIQTKTDVIAEPEKKLSTCEKIEKLLLRNLNPADSQDAWAHQQNAELYNKLSQHGCPENADAFKQLIAQETAIANALGATSQNAIATMRTCEEIEMVLKQQINEYANNSYERLHNADVYSTMAERGCPENSDKYKELALRQIEVVSAVSDEAELAQPQNAKTVVDTYKKLQMQSEARKFLNKIDRLIDPATNFILEMERVVNE